MTLFLSLLIAAGQLFGQLGVPTQVGPHIVGTGYTIPTPVNVAPGQLLTLMIDGTTLPLGPGQTVHATAGVDLPTELGSVAISFYQGVATPAPISKVQAFYGCYIQVGSNVQGRGECSPLGMVTVQIPFEAKPCSAPCGGVFLVSYQNGVGDLMVNANVSTDQVHILTTCDTVTSDSTQASASVSGLPCPSVVTHVDWSCPLK